MGYSMEIPCRVGDSVWGIRKHHRCLQARQGVVYEMAFREDMQLCICVRNVCIGLWGDKIFATKEEAEAAIRAREGAQ